MSLRTTQRTTLAIGIPLIIAMIGWTGLNVVSLLGMTTVQHAMSFALTGSRHVSVDTGSGRVTVEAGDVDRVEVTRTSRYGLAAPRFADHSTPQGVMLHAECTLQGLSHCSVSYEITVPADVSVDLASGSGTVRVAGLSGQVVATTGSGAVVAEGLSGAITLRSGSGSVLASDISAATTTASTGSGSVRLEFASAPHQVTARAGSGSVLVAVPAGSGPYRVEGMTGSGSRTIDVRTDPSSADSIVAHTGSGNVTVRQAP